MSNDTEVAEVADDGPIAALSHMFSYINTGGKLEISTFDPSTESGAEKLILATIGEIPDLASLTNMEIMVRDYLMHEAGRVSEDGEVETWQRIVVFDDKGQPYSCGSMGVRKCLEIMMRVRQAKLFDPPVKCTVKVTKLDGAKQWMTLVPNMDSLLMRNGKRK